MMSFSDIAAFDTPEYKEFLEKSSVSPYSEKEEVKSITKIPKIFIHSIEDKDIPFLQGMTVFTNAPETKEFIEFSGEHLMALKYESGKILSAFNKIIASK